MPRDADADLLAEFITESAELISRAEEALLTLETDPQDADAVNTVFRAFHTVKGTAAFMDLTLIADMGHHAESLLSRVRDGEIRYTGGYADLSLRALDTPPAGKTVRLRCVDAGAGRSGRGRNLRRER